MKQGTILIAKSTFGFKKGGKGRSVTVKEGQIFYKQHDGVMIDRENKGHISLGYFFST